MKPMTTYNRAAGYLNHLFDLLNEHYFEGALSKPVITIQSTPKAYGHYTLYDAWSLDGEKGLREINIGAGSLNRPIECVVATLMHELCHYYCDLNGIKDTSRGSTYHNRKFKEVAEQRGLQIDHHATYGWSITTAGEGLLEFCVENELPEIRLNRNDWFGLRIPGTGTHDGGNSIIPPGCSPKKSSSRKYVCPCCGMSVRATREVRVMCVDCGEHLVAQRN